MAILYVCMKCGKDVELDPQFKRVRCPFCGYKVLIKKRSGTIKKMKAR